MFQDIPERLGVKSRRPYGDTAGHLPARTRQLTSQAPERNPAMPAAAQHRRAKHNRLARKLAVLGTGAAVLALPVLGATNASAATTTTVTASSLGYADNLDGWIQASLQVMAQNGIPGTYDGIYRNVLRESSGNPYAINDWDSNAAAGTPSKGLLQVIDPTFDAYHVAGTSYDPYDPVANITAACNYAAAMYGSIDNVNGAY